MSTKVCLYFIICLNPVDLIRNFNFFHPSSLQLPLSLEVVFSYSKVIFYTPNKHVVLVNRQRIMIHKSHKKEHYQYQDNHDLVGVPTGRYIGLRGSKFLGFVTDVMICSDGDRGTVGKHIGLKLFPWNTNPSTCSLNSMSLMSDNGRIPTLLHCCPRSGLIAK